MFLGIISLIVSIATAGDAIEKWRDGNRRWAVNLATLSLMFLGSALDRIVERN